MDESSRLCRQLHSFLARKLPVLWLRQHGWFDFLNIDRPQTDDPVQLACEAFLYLTVNINDDWNGVVSVLTAVVAFLKQTTLLTPSTAQLRQLRDLLQKQPLDQPSVHEWFHLAYH